MNTRAININIRILQLYNEWSINQYSRLKFILIAKKSQGRIY